MFHFNVEANIYPQRIRDVNLSQVVLVLAWTGSVKIITFFYQLFELQNILQGPRFRSENIEETWSKNGFCLQTGINSFILNWLNTKSSWTRNWIVCEEYKSFYVVHNVCACACVCLNILPSVMYSSCCFWLDCAIKWFLAVSTPSLPRVLPNYLLHVPACCRDFVNKF